MAQNFSELLEAALADLTHFLQDTEWLTLTETPPWGFDFEISHLSNPAEWHRVPAVQEVLATPLVSQLVTLLRHPQVTALQPVLWCLISAFMVWFVMRSPHPFRGPRFRRRDTRRGYQISMRNDIFQSAGFRCESARFFIWGRCHSEATQVDHIYPWSRGGPTTRTNGQALCAAHNRRKSDSRPTWWYILSLERRRRLYYPAGTRVRVQAYPRRKEVRRRRGQRRRR